MPWRKEQMKCLAHFSQPEWKELVVQAIFGGGKTTMMLAMIQHLVLNGMINGHGIAVCAFNVCIKNEIKKKLRFLGNGFRVQTFDSIIYELCREMGYENLRALDFQEKRAFVRQHISKITPLPEIEYIFVDEAQDLEKIAYHIFTKRFPCARKIFVGDVFQSIQKEPRESMLWYMLRRPTSPEYVQYSMTDTPRVPGSVLSEIQTALLSFYPEFSSTIHRWTSSSSLTTSIPIQWTAFDSYKTVYNDMLAFIEEKGAHNVMILTFSSAVTVRGVLGDVSRVRQFLLQNDIPVNTNHKMMKDDAVFLSTANSSKGLEREYVFGFLTFPLELAFANFSDDLVVNLTTVALSRCKRSVRMYIPKHQDRFSKVLELYDSCPKPQGEKNVHALHMPKTCTDTVFSDHRENMRSMLEKEHSITEALRLSVLSFSTRTLLKSYAKKYKTVVFPQEHVRKMPLTEEDCTFCGIVFETLALSLWKNMWPQNSATNGSFMHHEVFGSFQASITKMRKHYLSFCSAHPRFDTLSCEDQVKGSCVYARLHLACFQKIFCHPSNVLIQKITSHWAHIKSILHSLKPSTNLECLKVQQNVTMPFLNGIADAMLCPPERGIVEIYEIKASKSAEWQNNALVQSILYGICMGKTLFRIHLVNVFSKESYSYSVHFGKDFFKVRQRVITDVHEWNLNCYLSKNVTYHEKHKKTFKIQNTIFVDGREDDMNSLFFAEILSPTKTSFISISSFSEVIADLGIKKIIVGRHLSSTWVKKHLSDIDQTLFRYLKWPKQCVNNEGSWHHYLQSIGWFDCLVDEEKNKRSYLEWSLPQCTFMVQWAHLCSLYNMDA